MSEKREVENNKNAGSDKTTQTKKERKNVEENRNWKGVFEDVTYSSGPGDNIFIFG